MAKLIVKQSPPLTGTVRIHGAKNSVLPIMAASLLTSEVCTLEEAPCWRMWPVRYLRFWFKD